MQKTYYLRYIDMKILTTSTNSQVVKIIPREYVETATVTLRDDQTNTVSTFSNITLTQEGDYNLINQAFSLKEGYYYDMVVTVSEAVIYKDKVFCTDQLIDQSNNEYYTINKDVYTSDTSYDDDYIIL
jgi:hypothetical protein